MSMAEAGRPIVDWSPRDDAHSGLRHTDRPAARPTGRVQHGYNRVQEIVSDTDSLYFLPCIHLYLFFLYENRCAVTCSRLWFSNSNIRSGMHIILDH